jgi:release factor glutamine methyltransferase
MMNNSNTVPMRELLRNITTRLSEAGIGNAGGEAEMILMFLTGASRADLYMQEQAEPDRGRLEEILARRCRREPLQYILGEAYFMNLRLAVGPGVLIPRPETEILVERVCRDAPRNGRICDVGTGSGAIALSVAYERPDLEVVAVDVSTDACRIAEANRASLRLDRVRIIHSDLLDAVNGRFDVIAANLPYITDEEYAKLQPEVRGHEPASALTSGADGLDLIRRLIGEAPDHLSPHGLLILEIGSGQGGAAAALMSPGFMDVEVIRDYNGLDRHVAGIRR